MLFRSVSVAQRYPVHSDKRAREHVEAYVSRRTASGRSVTSANFKRSSVTSLQPTEAQILAFEQAASKPRDPADVLAELLSIASAGPAHATSPKVVTAAGRARKAASEGRPIALLTRHARTAQLLKAMLRPLAVQIVEGEIPQEITPVTVVRFDSDLPRLDAFQEVVMIDYPWSTEVLERAVGSASEPGNPDRKSVV